ncbi:uncharacterized protein ANIA_11585 [Aspergillus nidulans FGSC A4]|uniref:Uncharacterized protein n=1 Tax=Emericella nidulans (strain FGSC A4 / ATCC 38163 / CBS 112.46 / NRRL 194 / M139) TaxID=227321 RepID=C8V5F0_EMENI|nr:hypothetical protein [Aspergillus nidulans FGSC A4]CBF73625.1 TPA: hypothetical protein ANIA_11585 [Aspergillus nidulans FGSC A4]
MTPPLVPPAQPGDTNFGLIPFSARRLELDWNIFAALDGSPQTSSPRPWKVLLLSNNISGNVMVSVCYHDIKLFYLKDPDKPNSSCTAIIN